MTRQAGYHHHITQLELQKVLSKILIASSSSYPIISICRSVSTQCYSNGLFLINLKMKLHVELFIPSNSPTCLCGATIDTFGKHTFCCCQVLKKMMHNWIHDGTAPILYTILKTAGIIVKGSQVNIEPKGVVNKLPGLRLYNSAFRPVPSLNRTTISPIPYSLFGLDFITTTQRICPTLKV